jgi:hypothetical protein
LRFATAPRLRPANVLQGPFPGLRSPVTAHQALRCQKRVAYAGSAPVAARCARPPFGCAFRLERMSQEDPAEPPQEGGEAR